MLKTSMPQTRKWFAFLNDRLEGNSMMRRRDQLKISYIVRWEEVVMQLSRREMK
jgi:hypothetical protein